MKKTVKIMLQSSMILQGILWFVFGVISFIRADTTGNMAVVFFILMLANGGIFISLALIVNTNSLLLKIFTMIFLFVNLILTVTDQTGLFDYCVLALNIIAISCFLYLRLSKKGPI